MGLNNSHGPFSHGPSTSFYQFKVRKSLKMKQITPSKKPQEITVGPCFPPKSGAFFHRFSQPWLSQVMQACAKAGKWWTTLALLEGLDERRLMPDEVIIGAGTRNCCCFFGMEDVMFEKDS